jgi:glycosyltransferase involved in cell wall biosynthesis
MVNQAPCALILSDEIPQSRNAGSILLYRLFAGYGRKDYETKGPRDERGEARQGAIGEGREEAQNFERDHFDISKDRSQAKLFVIGPKPHPEAELLDCPYRELAMPLRRLETSRFSKWKRSLQALGLIPLPSHRKVFNLLGGFRSEVVVCVMQNTPWILTAERTARKLGIPLVLIVHDLNEEFEKVFPWAKQALLKRNRQVYRAASRRLCVSPQMAEYLEKRYGVPGEVMYPNRSEELQPRALDDSLVLRESIQRHEARGERREGHASATLTLGYAGSLAYGYGEELVKLIDVLREVGARIRMFSPRPSGILDALNHATDVVEICGYRPALEAWTDIQKTCDAIILPYSNPAGSNELLYRTHFPSKLAEYLALGMPVIVSGPEFATGVKWAKGKRQERHEVGGEGQARHKAIGEGQEAKGREGNFEREHFDILKRAPNGAVPCTTREELVAVLQRLKADGELRRELAQRALEAGKRDFDPGRIREGLWRTLQETAA